jgi:hypothetical protein
MGSSTSRRALVAVWKKPSKETPMSDDVKREIGELLAEQLPNEAEWKTCEHVWVDHLQPGMPEPIRSWATCMICGYFNAADLAEQLAPLVEQRDQARGMVVELEGENAKLLADNERLSAETQDCCTCEQPTHSVDTFCWACQLNALEEDCDGLRNALAEAKRELAHVTAERDAAILAAEVATGTPCWRCGGEA